MFCQMMRNLMRSSAKNMKYGGLTRFLELIRIIKSNCDDQVGQDRNKRRDSVNFFSLDLHKYKRTPNISISNTVGGA